MALANAAGSLARKRSMFCLDDADARRGRSVNQRVTCRSSGRAPGAQPLVRALFHLSGVLVRCGVEQAERGRACRMAVRERQRDAAAHREGAWRRSPSASRPGPSARRRRRRTARPGTGSLLVGGAVAAAIHRGWRHCLGARRDHRSQKNRSGGERADQHPVVPSSRPTSDPTSGLQRSGDDARRRAALAAELMMCPNVPFFGLFLSARPGKAQGRNIRPGLRPGWGRARAGAPPVQRNTPAVLRQRRRARCSPASAIAPSRP